MEKDNQPHSKKRDRNRFSLKLLVLKILAILSILSFIYIYIIGDGDPDSPFPAIVMYVTLIFVLLYISEEKIKNFLAKNRKI
jgi:hypothetical protein